MAGRLVSTAVLVIIAVVAVLAFEAWTSDDPAPPIGQGETATVRWITDGDTIGVELANGTRVPVRLVGLNAPETHAGPECGGEEATDALKALVAPGDVVTMRPDATQSSTDQHGRLLRFVEHDGADLGEQQIAAGHARARVYGGEHDLADAYRSAEREARSAGRGLWGAC